MVVYRIASLTGAHLLDNFYTVVSCGGCVLNFDRSAPIWVKPDGFD